MCSQINQTYSSLKQPKNTGQDRVKHVPTLVFAYANDYDGLPRWFGKSRNVEKPGRLQ